MGVALLAEAVSATRRPYLLVLSGAHVGELHALTLPRIVVGRGRTANVRLTDEGVSRAHTEIIVRGEDVSARDLGSLNGTFHNGRRTAFCRLADGDKLTIGAMTVLKFSFQDGVQERFQRDLYASAVRDRVTHALRSEVFLERLQAEVAFSQIHSVPLSLIFWDLDDFQTLNALYGQPAGDRVLATVSEAVGRAISREQVLGRWGGDEFALICRGTPAEAAYGTAERLRHLIECTPILLQHDTVSITASFGLGVCPAPGISTALDLLRVADAAVFRAKSSGKNRTDGPP